MEKILKVYVRIFLLILPLFFLPIITDGYGAGKNILMVAGAGLGMVLWLVTMIVKKKNEVYVGRGWWLWLGLTVLAIISYTKLGIGMKSATWFQPLGLGSMLGLLGWGWLFLQVKDKDETRFQIRFLTMAGIIMVITSLITFLLPVSKFPILLPNTNPIISIGQNWTLAGSLMAELVVFLAVGGWWLQQLVSRYRKNQGNGYMVPAIFTAVTTLGVFLAVYKMVKMGGGWLDLRSSWVIATETFKQSPLWGVGISNFARAFEAYRPTSFNLTSMWSQGNASLSGLGILHWWTELGVGAMVLVLLLLIGIVKKLKEGVTWWWLLVTLGVVMYLPLQLTSLFVLVWMMSVVMESSNKKLVLKVGENGVNVLPVIVGGLMVLASLGAVYMTGRQILADYYFWQSMVAAAKNDGSQTYQWQIKAIELEPNRADYRRLYSQTNMALAKVLLTNKDISDEDKQKVSVLLQQAVREGKAAVALDGNYAVYWNNLALIYRDLIGVVDGAPDWALQAYQQALILDPLNPIIRLDMGGLYYAAGRYEEADRAFEQVVMSKQDFANGWYNWAYTAKMTNKLADAVQRLNQALSLVPSTSGDFDKASQELAAWKKELDEAIKKQQAASVTPMPTKSPESLRTPQPLPTINKEEQVNVPVSEFEPPKVIPQPTATNIPKPSVTVVP